MAANSGIFCRLPLKERQATGDAQQAMYQWHVPARSLISAHTHSDSLATAYDDELQPGQS